MSDKETAEDVRRQISLAMGWGNVPPTDILVRDANTARRAIAKLQVHLAVLHMASIGKVVDQEKLKEARTVSANLARALFP